MIKYIIIENEQKYIEIYKRIINKIMIKQDIDYSIDEFTYLNDKLKRVISENSCSKIYLTDICLDSNNTGIDVAKQIRNIDNKSEIIFITCQDIMFETVFKNVRKVYSFICKYNNMETKLEHELKDIIKYYTINTNFLVLDKKGNSKVAIDDILYIYRETVERKIYIVTKDNKYPTYMSLKDILDNYGDYFIQIHRACLINPQKIDMYNWNEKYFILKNGYQVFMCSKKYKNNIV